MPARKKAMTRKKSTTPRKTAARKPAAKKATARKTTKKATVRKTIKKTPAKRKTTAKKKPTKKTMAKSTSPSSLKITSSLTKSQLYTIIGEHTGLAKKQVQQVFDTLTDVIQQHVIKRGPQIFTLPGLLKIKVVRKPATKARKGINPFTGEPTVFKAKPARNVVKVQALKKLKEMAT